MGIVLYVIGRDNPREDEAVVEANIADVNWAVSSGDTVQVEEEVMIEGSWATSVAGRDSVDVLIGREAVDPRKPY